MRKALYRFEQTIDSRDIDTLNKSDAMRFKEKIRDENLKQGVKRATIAEVRKFYQWLYAQPGHKSKISSNAIDYLRLSRKEVEASKNCPIRARAKHEQVIPVILELPETNEVEFRDKAMLAFLVQTGVRAKALITLRLEHIDLDDLMVNQLADEVDTKFGKNLYSPFLSINAEFNNIVPRYFHKLTEELGFGEDDPIFPKLLAQTGAFHRFGQNKLSKNAWTSSQQVLKIVKKTFDGRLDIPVKPHDFRHMLVAELGRRNLTFRELRAWSQALGHESLAFTFGTYGKLMPNEIAEIAKSSWSNKDKHNGRDDREAFLELHRQLRKIIDDTDEDKGDDS